MKRIGKPVFFIVAAILVVFSVLTFTGVTTQYGDIKTTFIRGVGDIRLGIDIRGGVDVTFVPEGGQQATEQDMHAVKQVIEQRLIGLNITDYEIYEDTVKSRLVVRFPWKEDEAEFDAEQAVQELGSTALLTFREGNEVNEQGKPDGVTDTNVLLTGSDVESAQAYYDSNQKEYIVQLTMDEDGTKKFEEATEKLKGEVISIWLDDQMISYPTVNDVITDGVAVISGGNMSAEEANSLANKINAGALPFKLETASVSTISPTLGVGALNAMVLAGIIAFVLVSLFMLFVYRLPGAVAILALLGQVAGSLAAVSGFFGFLNSFTLTLPGIAGIILSIGMGVDANIITAERIKEEIRGGASLNNAVDLGFKRAFSAIFDGNITVIIVAIILMGAFGPTDSMFSGLLRPFFFMFGQAAEGTVYSFGYTLLVGVIFNFIMGITASRLMLKSLSKFKMFKNPWLYGGKKV